MTFEHILQHGNHRHPTSPLLHNMLPLYTIKKSNCGAPWWIQWKILIIFLQHGAHVNIANATHHMTHYVKKMTSCTKPKYVTYCTVIRGGPSHGHR